MRNLKIVSYQETSSNCGLPLRASAWDTSNDSVICAFGPTPTQPIIELKRRIKLDPPDTQDGNFECSQFAAITSWDAPCPLPDLACDEILLMHYFSDTSTICLVMAGGDLILVREDPSEGQEKIEIVGSVDVGIAAAAWAPDQELMAIVTRSDNLVLMSRDLEPVTETIMAAEDLQSSKHVSVGWGKKETQFQGKRAKAMRDPTMPEHVDEGLASQFEDGRTTLSWRGDGAYVAVNAIVQGQRRVIRVYSREGVLDSVSEPVDGLESALSWRPAGNLIAGIKRSMKGDQTKLEVVFFERNGLRHGDFELRLNSSDVNDIAKQVNLAWNLDSTVLAVSFSNIVQYWTMGNYHYYLKQEINLTTSPEDRSMRIVWHAEKSLKCCTNDDTTLLELELLSHVNRGTTIKPNDYGLISVIDGAILKLTPLKHAGVPPPMSFLEVQTESNIIDTAISKNGQLIAILMSSGIDVISLEMRSSAKDNAQGDLRHTTSHAKHRLLWSDLGIGSANGLSYTQVVFKGDSEVYALAPAQQQKRATLVHISLCPVEDWQGRSTIVSAHEQLVIVEDSQSVLTDSSQDSAWVQNKDTTVCLSQPESLSGAHPSTAIYNIAPAFIAGQPNGFHHEFHKVSLTLKGSLMADQRVLARDCTSFVLTDQHLIYTTAQHLLKFVHLDEPEKMQVPGDTPEVDERCRSVERGAKIVTVMPSAYSVVLQMPRGNLETIYPRVLVLTGIRDNLSSLEYRTAFLACQTHQVDMNILHDYLPDVFMANVQKVIDDLKKPGRVDEFLSKLKDEDVTQTLYKDTLSASAEAPVSVNSAVKQNGVGLPSTTSNKVNAVCDAFISVLKKKPGKFLQCIITANVCKRPPDLTAALTLVSSLRQSSSEEADLAISHLCFLTDTNRLYDAALALYDLELTLLVAQNAQRDPREYMPFLQNLQSLPPLRRQYQIDNHLKNYPKALTSLHALEAHEEVESYTIKHVLYTHAVELYKYQPTQLTRITVLHAKYLTSQSQHAAAATLYESLGLYTEAYPLYALSHQWRESLTCATLIPLAPPQLQSLALSLATTCADESRDYRSAATIHLEYLSSPSSAAKLLCKSSYFADALRLLAHHNLHAEISSTIDTALGDKVSEILALLADCKSQLAAQVPRIAELRIAKATDPLAFFGGDPLAGGGIEGDIPDNVSLAPTDATTAGGQSLFTRYGGSQGSKFAGTVASNVSRKTSRTKRREERKRARGKKGSVYEEEYLVASVGRLIERVNGVHDEVGRLVAGLLRRGMRDRAVRVEEVMSEMGVECKRAKEEVWGADEVGLMNGEVVGEGGVPAEDDWRPSGADGVFWDSQQMSAKKEKPIVKLWKGNALVMR